MKKTTKRKRGGKLPKHIRAEDADYRGKPYYVTDQEVLYSADWSPSDLRAIADDIESRTEIKRKRARK